MAALSFDDIPDTADPGGDLPFDPSQSAATPAVPKSNALTFDDIPSAAPARPLNRDSAYTSDVPPPAPSAASPAVPGWDDRSYLNQSGNQLASGWETVKQGFNTIGAGTSAQTLRDMDAVDAGQMPTNLANVEYYQQADPATRAQLRADQERQFGGQLGSIVQSQQYQAGLPSNPRAAALGQQVNAGDYSGAWRTFRSDPMGILSQGMMQGLPAAAPAIAGSMLGPLAGAGVLGSMAGVALGSYASQVGPRSLQYLDENLRAMGVNTADPEAMARAIIARPQVVRDAFGRGGAAALGPAFIDGITMGLTRGVISGAGLVANAGRIAGDTALAAVDAPAGEAAAQYLGEGRVNNPGAVVQAAGSALPIALAHGVAASINARQGGIPLNMQPEPPPAEPPQIAGPPGQPPAAPSPGVGHPVEPPPPASGPSPEPQAAAGPPVVPPVLHTPGEQVFNPATMTAPRSVLDILAQDKVPLDVALQRASSELAAFTKHWGPDVTQSMIEAKPLPRSADAIMASDPSIGAPQATRIADAERKSYEAETGIPQPRNAQAQRGEVEAFLNDPRSNKEIQAEMDAPLQAAVQTAQRALPPGFTFEKDDGVWTLTSPSGDATAISTKPIPTESESAAAAGLADHLNKNIDYSKYLRVGAGTPESPIKPLQASDVPAAAQQVAEPTPAQAQAGNYKMGHLDIAGVPISIETPAGATRSGTAPDGTPWSVEMPADYGRIKRTVGADGDHVDVYLGPRAHDAASLPVYIVDQKTTPGWEFDEHKVMLGFPTLEAAKHAYWQGFSDGLGPQRMGAITEMPFDHFRKWLKAGDTTKPIAYHPPPIPPLEKQRAIYNRPLSLLEFLGAAGGVKDQGGELAAMGLTKKFLPKIGRLVRQSGMSLDYAREAAQEAGYLPKESANNPSQIGISDLLDLMDREARGTKVFRPDDEAEMFAAQQAEREATDEERLQIAMGDVQQLAEAAGMRLSRSETEEAATAILGGADRNVVMIEVAERAAVEADAAAAATAAAAHVDEWDIPWEWKEEVSGNVEEPSTGRFPGDDAAGQGGEAAGPRGPPAVEPAAHSEQPAGGDGHVPAANPGDQAAANAGKRGNGEQLLPGFSPTTERERAENAERERVRALQGASRPPDHGLFSPAAGHQTDLVDAVRAETGYGSIAEPNIVALAGAFRDYFATQGFQTVVQARQFAGKLIGTQPQPGTHAAKLIDEAIELGVVLRARQIVQSGADQVAAFHQLVDLYGKQPNLGVRTSESVERQAYSTPVPLAFLASRLAQINRLTTVFEPTAGNGALLLEAEPSLTSANELDPGRAVALAAQGFEPTQFDAVKIPALAGQFDRVIANPPFGAVKGDDGKTVIYPMDWVQPGYHTGEIDHAIALTSLATLKDDGRAVLLLGGLNKLLRTPQARAKGYHGKAKREFFLTLYNRYNVVDHFTVPGELYERQGAGWPVDVIVIQGRGKSALPLPAVAAPRIEGSWPALGELLNGTVASGPEISVGGAGQPSGERGPDQPVAKVPHVTGILGKPILPSVRDDDEGRPPISAGGSPGGGTGAAGGVVRGAPGRGPRTEETGAGTDSGQPRVPRPIRDSGDAAGPAAVAGEPDAGGAGSVAGDDAGRVDEPSPAGTSEQRVAADLAAPPPDIQDQAPAKKGSDEAPAPSQVPYVPRSKMTPVGTLVPLNLRTAAEEALTELMRGQSNTGKSIDEYVAGKLGYSMDQLEQYFSAEQVDAIALGIANVDKGQGFVIGDQTGVGKGRFVAAMIRYADRAGHTPIFVTEKPNLFADMARDLTDIGMADFIDKIVPTNTSLNLPLTDDRDGPRLKTPGAKAHNDAIQRMANERRLPEGKRVLFTTYAQQQQQAKRDTPRMNLLRALAPNAFIILDESHNAGGVGGDAGKPKTMASGKIKMPRSAFFREVTQAAHSAVFSSATWAKRPDTIDLYAAKTDMRKAVDDINKLSDAIKKGGVPMQQIVSAGLVQVGQYVRRERSFDGVTYDIQSVPVDHGTYDRFAGLLADIFRLSEDYAKPTIEEIGGELVSSGEVVGADGAIGSPALHTVGFSSIMHNIIEQMLLASKAKGAADLAIERFKAGEKPIITVANTMGAFIGDYAETVGASLGDRIDLTFNQLVLNYLKRNLRFTIKPPFADEDTKATVHWIKPEDLGSEGEKFYRELEARIKQLDLSAFPASPIDYMRAQMVRAGMRVAEITGRTEAADYVGDTAENSHVIYRRRGGKETGITGRRETINGYNRGDIDALVLNQSGATGISLHASRTYKDQSKRVMIIAQAERNIDTHMQMLGRVHRTGQVRTPAYLQLVADVPAENRPAAVLQQKMASLSASTTSNRKSAVSAGNAPDFINTYGGFVVMQLLMHDEDLNRALGGPIDDFNPDSGDFEVLVRRVTGRIPLLPLAQQKKAYEDIEIAYRAMIEELDAAGENALEAKTLDLDARHLETRVLKEGVEGSANPFEAAANLQKMDVKRTVKPPKPHEIVHTLARQLDQDESYTIEGMEEQTLDQLAGHIRALAQDAGKQRTANAIDELRLDHARAVGKAQKLKDKEKRGPAEEAANGTRDRIRAILQTAKPGTMVDVAIPGELIPQTALVLNVHQHGENANTPSSWHVMLQTAEGLRRTIPGTQVYTPANAPKADADDNTRVLTPSTKSVVDFLADMKDLGTFLREERWIITGNILAGFAEQTGQIVNFTDADGAIRQGVMMARSFDAERFTASRAQHFTPDQAISFLRSTQDLPPFVENKNETIRIAASDDGGFVMTVPASKKEGGEFFLSAGIRNAAHSSFVSAGGEMRMTFGLYEVADVVRQTSKVLNQQGDELISRHPAAKGFISGKPTPPKPRGGIPEVKESRAPDGWGFADTSVPVVPRIQPRAYQALATTIQAMTGNRVTIDTVSGPLVNRATGKTAAGSSAGGVLITVSLQGDTATGWLLHHEAVHSLRTFNLIRPSEWRVLEATADAKGWAARYDITTRYPDLAPEAKQEEAVAEGFADYMAHRQPPPAGVVGASVNRVKTFFGRLKSALNGNGFTRAEDVFERIASGSVGQREAAPTPERPVMTVEDARDGMDRRYSKEPVGLDELHVGDDGGARIDLMAGMSEPLRKAIAEGAGKLAKKTTAALSDHWKGETLPPGVRDLTPELKPDLGVVSRYLGRPTGWMPPELRPVFEEGLRAEEKESIWIRRLATDYERAKTVATKADADLAKVWQAMLYGDENGIDNHDDQAKAALFAEHGLEPAEQRAFDAFHAVLDKVARLVDQHRRAMMPKVQLQQAMVWEDLQHTLDTVKGKSPDFRRLYKERSNLAAKVRDGVGDLDAASKRIDEINKELRALRSTDPVTQAKIAPLQDAYDALESRLAQQQVRGVLKGYVPHKFFGSWRVWVQEAAAADAEPDADTGERPIHVWREVTSDQGFYNNRREAVRAIRSYKKQHPDAVMKFGPKQIQWPFGMEGTELSDASFRRLTAGLAEQAQVEGAALDELLEGVARRRARRRIYSSALHREGAEGFSRDMDRVFRAHIGQSVRYVTRDRLKYIYVSSMERLRLSRQSLATNERKNLIAAMEQWFQDINGGKQSMEEQIDASLQKMPVGRAVGITALAGAVVAGLASVAATGGGAPIPWAMGLVGSYAGFKMWKALGGRGPIQALTGKPGTSTDFTTRQFTSGIVSDGAHLRLGMLTNIHAAYVNLGMLATNVYPTLGERWTTVGARRAAAAMWDSMRGNDTPDAKLLDRADIRTSLRLGGDNPIMAEHESRLKRASMFMFHNSEVVNRATMFLGAYARAENEGQLPGPAFATAQRLTRQNLHHYGNASKPELMRKMLAKIPSSGLNWMVQQSGWIWSEGAAAMKAGAKNRGKVARALLSQFLVAGFLGFFGVNLVGGLVHVLTGLDPVREVKTLAIEAQALGNIPGNMAGILSHGLPGYLVDTTQSMGLADGPIPTSPDDLVGADLRRLGNVMKALKEGYGLVDTLNTISPSFKWLKALETAANGFPITDSDFWTADAFQQHTLTAPGSKDQVIYHPNKRQMIEQATGFQPIEQSQMQEAHGARIEDKADQAHSKDAYLRRVNTLVREKRAGEVAAVMMEAKKNGIQITQAELVQEVKKALLPETTRDLKAAPKANRPDVVRQNRLIEDRLGQ